MRQTAESTNVVMILTDDQGVWAAGCYGNPEIRTPSIDRLARTGVRLDNCFCASPVCSPSRMTYLTGRLPSTHGVQDWLRPVDSFGARSRAFLDGHPTFTEVLAANGYTVGLSGKWHMGRDEKAQRGFTYWCTIPGGGGTYRDPVFVQNGAEVKTTGYKTDLVTDFALEFIDQNKVNPEKRLAGLRFRINAGLAVIDATQSYEVELISLSGMLIRTDQDLVIEGLLPMELLPPNEPAISSSFWRRLT